MAAINASEGSRLPNRSINTYNDSVYTKDKRQMSKNIEIHKPTTNVYDYDDQILSQKTDNDTAKVYNDVLGRYKQDSEYNPNHYQDENQPPSPTSNHVGANINSTQLLFRFIYLILIFGINRYLSKPADDQKPPVIVVIIC